MKLGSVKEDLTGVHFGNWEVLRYKGNSLWECRCSCGTIKDIKTGKLTCGQTLSCGHEKVIDITGKTFGDWEVLSYDGNGLWKCRCSCGIVKDVMGKHLRNGKSTSCGHNGSPKRIDLTGQQFGEYTVIEYAGNKMWKCQCSCGKINIIAGSRLRSGETKSCGHKGKLTDLSGRKFGQLEVIKYTGYGSYLCKCSCGNLKSILGKNLLNGSTLSCGCMREMIYTKDFLKEAIEFYKNKYNRLPFKQELAKQLGISYGYMVKLVHDNDLGDLFDKEFSSFPEKEIYDLLKGIDNTLNIKIHVRDVLSDNKELDFYLPDKNMAIEFNGDYWHNSDVVSKNYHQNKTLNCNKLDIQLIHIFEYEWDDYESKKKIIELIKSYIGNKNNVAYARNCRIKNVNKEQEQEFINKYHLQGYTSSSIAYGLYQENELISIMTFGSPRFNKNYEWELIRYCTKDNVAIIGGAERLFKEFIRTKDPASIISYCDISKFSGKVYNKLGFKTSESSITYPNYKWVKWSSRDNTNDVLSRYQTQKYKLIESGYGEYGDTEDEIMQVRGYFKIYDCGNRIYTWNKQAN